MEVKSGDIFGRLTILEEIENIRRNKYVIAKCSCNGNINEYRLSHLVDSSTVSCGCYQSEADNMAHQIIVCNDHHEHKNC